MKTCILAVVFFWLCAPVHAAVSKPTHDEVILVQTLVGEAGWRPLRDHAAILHVLERRSRQQGRSLAQMARAYSTLHRPGPATPHRLQTLALNEETVPVWALSLVRSFEAGELEDPCHGRAWHWGSKTDALRFFLINPRAQVVDCGPTANVFLR